MCLLQVQKPEAEKKRAGGGSSNARPLHARPSALLRNDTRERQNAFITSTKTSMTTMYQHTTRWTTILSSKVNLPHAINVRALCGQTLVTKATDFRANETLVACRVVRPLAKRCRGTSPIRKCLLLGPYSRLMPSALRRS